MNQPVGVQAIIQARMGSTRLPGKVMKNLAGRLILEHVVRRVQTASFVERAVVATTDLPTDDIIAEWCSSNDIPCFRGSQNDVLDRFIRCAHNWPCRNIVRITADCPFSDPGVIDSAIFHFLQNDFDYVSNLHPPTFPHGLDVEIVKRNVLKGIADKTAQANYREHVTLFIRENRPDYKIGNVIFGRDCSKFRLTLDYPEDFELFEKLAAFFATQRTIPSIYELLEILEKHPELTALNSRFSRFVPASPPSK